MILNGLFPCGFISIHAPRGGSDLRCPSERKGDSLFQSTLPVGGATAPWASAYGMSRISIHAPRGGSDDIPATSYPVYFRISIHAPRGGSDLLRRFRADIAPYFNPRSPWGERLNHKRNQITSVEFQSTLPVGGATWRLCPGILPAKDFNPRSPWGERRSSSVYREPFRAFQSTLPVGGATQSDCYRRKLQTISIHAPRGGSDRSPGRRRTCPSDFNPRSPWGERP